MSGDRGANRGNHPPENLGRPEGRRNIEGFHDGADYYSQHGYDGNFTHNVSQSHFPEQNEYVEGSQNYTAEQDEPPPTRTRNVPWRMPNAPLFSMSELQSALKERGQPPPQQNYDHQHQTHFQGGQPAAVEVPFEQPGHYGGHYHNDQVYDDQWQTSYQHPSHIDYSQYGAYGGGGGGAGLPPQPVYAAGPQKQTSQKAKSSTLKKQSKSKPPPPVEESEEEEEDSNSSENSEDDEPKKKISVSKKTPPKSKKTANISKKHKSKPKKQSTSDSEELSEENSESDDEDLLPRAKQTSKSKRESNEGKQTPSKYLKIIRNVHELEKLGIFAQLSITKPEFGFINEYVVNGFGQVSSRFQVKIHAIHELTTKVVQPTPAQPAPAQPAPAQPAPAQPVPAAPTTTTPPLGNSSSSKLLLFMKTSPGAVSAIASAKDGCAAYYDRIVRAISVSVPEIRGRFRQIILLSAVSLGTVEKSEEGFHFWSKRGKAGLKQGCDTVKSVGKFAPDWDWSREAVTTTALPPITIPCGKTRRSRSSQRSKLDYNEYIVFEGKRAEVMYAVDVEIIP